MGGGLPISIRIAGSGQVERPVPRERDQPAAAAPNGASERLAANTEARRAAGRADIVIDMCR